VNFNVTFVTFNIDCPPLQKLLANIMAGTETLNTKLDELNETIASERSEVTTALETLRTSVDELKAKVTALEEQLATSLDLTAEIAKVEQAIADTQNIFTDTPPPVEDEVIE
jgi:Tfp pilus assembly protein PilO